MSDVKLGELLNGGESRDAIHVAIIQVIANSNLKPGQLVGLIGSSKEIVGESNKPIGIIDPFLKDIVQRGQKCYMLLYPNTVTGMKHHWEHPSFVEHVTNEKSNHDKSIQILKYAAEQGGMSYKFLLDSMTSYAEHGYRCHMGENEEYSGITGWNDIWEAWSKITGLKVPDDAWCPFTCSC